MDHEAALVEAFIVEAKRERFTSLLANPGKRGKITRLLAHLQDLDPTLMKRVPNGQQSASGIEKVLRSLGAPTLCHVVSESASLDQRKMPLAEALDMVVGSGLGTLISCIPGRLAYYESEEQNERYVLQKPAI